MSIFAEMEHVFKPPADRDKPLLPFSEHIAAFGAHHLYKRSFNPVGEFNHSYFAAYIFPNGHKVSVITGPQFYCSETHPYELYWQTQPAGSAGDGIYGHLNDEQLMLKLAYIFNHKPTE